MKYNTTKVSMVTNHVFPKFRQEFNSICAEFDRISANGSFTHSDKTQRFGDLFVSNGLIESDELT